MGDAGSNFWVFSLKTGPNSRSSSSSLHQLSNPEVAPLKPKKRERYSSYPSLGLQIKQRLQRSLGMNVLLKLQVVVRCRASESWGRGTANTEPALRYHSYDRGTFGI